jgi:membrane associated rhomboid family serine protease
MRYGRGGYNRLNLNVLWTIIGINIVVFLIDLMVYYSSFLSHDLGYYLALYPRFVWSEPWTLVTSMFMHGDMWHIFFNMLWLYFFGSYVIMLVGNRKFLLVYFIGGIVGGLFYVWLAANPLIPVIGASGAVFALGGALAVMQPKLKVMIMFIPRPIPLWAVVIFSFLFGFLFRGIAWQGHLGGLLVGVAFGSYFRRKQQRMIFFR